MKHSNPIASTQSGVLFPCQAEPGAATAARPLRQRAAHWSAPARRPALLATAASLPLQAPHINSHQARLGNLGAMTASMAHEVNQPLAAIALHAQVALLCLEREQSSDSKAQVHARKALAAVIEASNRAHAIVHSIRKLAQNAAVAFVPCRVDAALSELLPLLQGELDRHDIKLHIDIAAATPQVLADPVQLRQVLLNLLNNAIEAMHGAPRRELSVTVRLDGAGALRVSIADSGAGLPDGAAARVFEPLFTTKPNGMGMGLAICRAIVEAHGGAIWAAAGARHGSVFGFSLPCAQEPR